MNKLKVLLTILMGTLIAFSAQRAYYVKTGELSSIYSDIIFTRLAVESQEYTRQIEYGVKNGKSLENFYNISSVLSGVRRCCSYTNGVYIFSSDRRQLYSLNDGGSPVTRFSVGDFSGGSVYSVYDDSAGGRYVLTLPIFGRGNRGLRLHGSGYQPRRSGKHALRYLGGIPEAVRRAGDPVLADRRADDDTSLQIKREAVPAGNSGDISGGVHAVRA